MYIEIKKTDRRIRYTKMVIKESFIKFLKQKPISKISVKEICDDADINRATFYAHYLDQYDLLYQIENEIINDINEYLKNYEFKVKNVMPFEMTEKILEYVKKNADIFDTLLNLNGDINFQNELTKIIAQHSSLMNKTDSVSKEDVEYIFHFLTTGSVGIIQKWLKDGMKKPSKELAQLILKMAFEGQSSF